MMRTVVARALCALTIFIAGCGGSNAPAEAPAQRAQRASPAAITLNATTAMDWAEGRYPDLFPGHSPNQAFDIYIYRAYPNGNYLGVSIDGGVHVLGPTLTNGVILRVGNLADFACGIQPQNCSASVSVTGTAATGGPIAGMTVTLVDSAGRTATAATSSAGSYTLNTAGLAGPFLLRVATPGGATLYGVTAGTGGAVVANITPLTDLIVRSWYSAQGISADAAFANPAAAPPPTREQARAVAETVLSVMQLALNNSNAGVSGALDLIDKPFAADRTGMDELLGRTHITYDGAGAAVTVSGTNLQQVSSLAYGSALVTVSSTTASSGNTTTAAFTAVVPVPTAPAAAWNEIDATIGAFAALVNTKGASLTAADILPYLDPNLLDDGVNRDQFAAEFVSDFDGGQSLALQIRRMNSLDLALGSADVVIRVTESLGGESASEEVTLHVRKVSGVWLLSGNRQIADIGIHAEARIDQGTHGRENGPSINVHISPLQNAVSAVSVTGNGGSIAITRGSTSVDDTGVLRDTFLGNTGALQANALPAAGTLYTVTMTRVDGGISTVTVPLNAFTTEGVPITSPTGTTLADAHLGGTLDVAWQLPVSYAVQRVQLSALVFTDTQGGPGGFQCESPQVFTAATATSGTLSVPATCNGLPVRKVNINLSVTGINGERSQTIYTLQ